ncbi:ADP-ribose glycohydrolase OARD1-like isoform X2 [Pristis pectinata]|uniref:ADP-ribose glycohydrolase OARD1-like isoform X2 n=1 Tax=Pristis pectinata TaxID=685728 RepID=UPI00223C9687|nr:ADP-ribose glycohydrolase OARD1-like isoform X2 [Pristis pectinata]
MATRNYAVNLGKIPGWMNKMMNCTEKPPERNGFAIRYVTGDLFKCPPEESLAHCISEDCRMGAGIAVAFKERFGCVKQLLDQKKKTGEVAVLKKNQGYIYYLITKKRAFHKPTYESLQRSLEAMKKHCISNEVMRISMPRIGCGLDKLSWNEVAVRIQEVFKNTNIVITVYSLGNPAVGFPQPCKKRKSTSDGYKHGQSNKYFVLLSKAITAK